MFRIATCSLGPIAPNQSHVIQALAGAGYTGYLGGEWFHNQYGARPEDALELYSYEVRELTHKHGVALGLL